MIRTIIEKFQEYRYRRRMKNLVRRGLKLGKNITIEPTVFLDHGYPYLISIGDNCSLAQNVRVLAHDATTFKFLEGNGRVAKVEIKENVFIGENTIVLPGATIGPNVLIAAGSIVNKDIPPNSCVAGAPCRFYKKFDEFMKDHAEKIKNGVSLNYKDVHIDESNEKAVRERNEMIRNHLSNGNVYIKGWGDYKWTVDGEDFND